MSTLYADPAVLWARLLERVTVAPDGCWLFKGALNSRGYGCVSAGRSGKTVLTHRLAVIVRDGAIPAGLTVDHRCHHSDRCDPATCQHRRCINPAHLKVVTGAANTARQFESGRCREGHLLTDRLDGRGRQCLPCKRAQYHRRRAA